MKRRDVLGILTAAPAVWIKNAIANETSFPQGRRFAVTFSIDDGFWKSALTFLSLFDRYGYKATFNLVTSWITPKQSDISDEYNQGTSHGTWTNWKKVLDRGHEIGSHSMTHPHLPQLSPNDLKRELLYSKRRITKQLQLWGSKTFALPYNDSSPDVRTAIGNYYIAAREGTRTGEINEPGSIDFLGVRSWWPLQQQPLSDVTNQIDRAREIGGWLVIGLHGMNGDGWHPITTEKMDGVLKYLSTLEDVWVDTFKNVAVWLMKRA